MTTIHQKRYDMLASNTLFLQSACSVVGNLWMGTFVNDRGAFGYGQLTAVQTAVLWFSSTLIVLAHAYCIRKGYWWAKLILLLFFGGSLLRGVLNFSAMSINNIHSPAQGFTALSQLLLSAIAVVLVLAGWYPRKRSLNQESTPAEL